ncbi:hypothetical protein K0504_09800 [Neiella marina]|uniref:Uncharacterized protein n=1 Tax=Neiella holothuriorum TaxID=2870530 RepID=A0ABS7EGK5_9GAMM|nr:hypothetical protein [Neiella holothuriorum]MBW8191330.1 hypothetical protein [Neiella holothuriorum]
MYNDSPEQMLYERRPVGFIQLIDRDTGAILAQRRGLETNVGYMMTHVWRVTERQRVIYSHCSGVTEPAQFFHPIRNEETIQLYADALTVWPENVSPSWQGLALELDPLRVSVCDIVGPMWSAFSNRKWVGTSEY